jgi:transcriptional regulator with XRE-family HTH domain
MDVSSDSASAPDYHANMAVGNKIKQRRTELERDDPVRYSVEATAKAAGMKASTLYGLERGDQQTSSRLPWLCEYLGLNINWVDRDIGPRLTGGPDATPVLQPVVSPGQSTAGEQNQMGGMARDVLETSLKLASLPAGQREAISAVIDSLSAQQSAEKAQSQRFLPSPEQSKPLRK